MIDFGMESGHELPKSWTFLNSFFKIFCFPTQRLSIYYYIYSTILNSWRGSTLPGGEGDISSERRHPCSRIEDSPRSVHNTGLRRHRTAMIVSTYERLRVGAHKSCRPQRLAPGWQFHLLVSGSLLRLVGALVEVHKLPAVTVLPVQFCSLPDSWVSTGLAARSDERAAMASA